MKGSSSNSGPAPDPNALRRERDGDTWLRLPAAGRSEPAPAWPLTGSTSRERTHWAREWARPQAIVWERLNLAVEVALYVRTLAVAERIDAGTNLRTLLKQQQEALGLSLPGLARNRWTIEAEPTPKVKSADARRSQTRSRLSTIDGGQA